MGASYSSCEPPRNPAFPDTASLQDGQPENPEKPAALQPPVDIGSPLLTEVVVAESLKWESISGVNFSITKPLNPNFFLTHRVLMGTRDAEMADPSKVLRGANPEYSFGATVANDKFLLMGTMNDRGILTSRATWRATEALTAKYESRISPTDYGSPMYMVDVEYTGTDWNGQLKTGMNGFYGANYMQTLFPGLSAGGEIFYLSEQGRSGMGVAARLNDEKAVGTLQLATTGILSMTYHHRVNDKASLAADFLFNVGAPGEACASVGYDYTFRQCRLRGSIDSNGKVAALLEELLAPGVRLILSGELDHARADHKFGFGMTFGE